jgi:hypothetical protein
MYKKNIANMVFLIKNKNAINIWNNIIISKRLIFGPHESQIFLNNIIKKWFMLLICNTIHLISNNLYINTQNDVVLGPPLYNSIYRKRNSNFFFF